MLRESSKLLSTVIEEYIRECDLSEGLLAARVSEAWDLLMTEVTSPHLTPAQAARLTSSKYYRNGVLTCRITSSVIRTKLSFELESLRGRLNTMLQGDYVQTIRLS